MPELIAVVVCAFAAGWCGGLAYASYKEGYTSFLFCLVAVLVCLIGCIGNFLLVCQILK